MANELPQSDGDNFSGVTRTQKKGKKTTKSLQSDSLSHEDLAEERRGIRLLTLDTRYNDRLQLERFPSPYNLDDQLSFVAESIIGEVQREDVQPFAISTRSCNHLSRLREHDPEGLRAKINENLMGIPTIFYVVETNNPQLIRDWVKHGGDPNATCGTDHFPVLAFAILHGAKTRLQCTQTVETLLDLGASPDVFPKWYFVPYNRDLPESGPQDEELVDIQDANKTWCVPIIRASLASRPNLMQRYRLFQAHESKRFSGRQRNLASRKDAEGVLSLHLSMVGQRAATELLQTLLMGHLAVSGRKPLVLMFAGPSGHGKTELARRLGGLLSLDFHSVDCTTFTRVDELFGPRPPYIGWEEGSPLNNFLARNDGKRCVVFMDEFEKTGSAIHNALLIPFDQGEYRDFRTLTEIDCSKTIWILATNKFDDQVLKFCRKNGDSLSNPKKTNEQAELIDQLCRELEKDSTGYFGSPLTGRLKKIIPFLTFSPDEAAVLACEGIMQMEDRLAKPVHLSTNQHEDNLVGNVTIDMRNESSICSTIARKSYLPQLGARSIFNGVDDMVQTAVVNQYLEDGEDFTEDQDETRVQSWHQCAEGC